MSINLIRNIPKIPFGNSSLENLILNLLFIIPVINLFYTNVKLIIILYIAVCIIFTVNLFRNDRCIRINIVQLLFLLMLVILLIPFFIFDIESFWGNYLSFILSAMLYFLFFNLKANIESHVIVFVKLSTIILCTQLIYKAITIITSGVDSDLYKANIQLSLGNSNSLGFFLLILFFIIYNCEKKGIINSLLLFMLMLSIVLLQSRSTIIAFIVTMIFLAAERKFKKVLVTLITFCVLLVSFQYIYDEAKGKMFKGYYSGVPLIESAPIDSKLIELDTGISGNGVELTEINSEASKIYKKLDDISSKRLTLYRKVYEEFKISPVLGLGLGNVVIDFMGVHGPVRSHNIVLDLLAFSGVLGLLVYSSILIVIIRFLWENKKTPYVKGVFYGLIAILLQGMLEPNIFSLNVDLYLWTILGSCYVIIKHIHARDDQSDLAF